MRGTRIAAPNELGGRKRLSARDDKGASDLDLKTTVAPAIAPLRNLRAGRKFAAGLKPRQRGRADPEKIAHLALRPHALDPQFAVDCIVSMSVLQKQKSRHEGAGSRAAKALHELIQHF